MYEFCKRLSHIHETLPFIRVNVEALLQIQIRILHFPICVIKTIGFPIFHSEWFSSCLVPAMDCLKLSNECKKVES